jgi:hypothetical protein
MKTLALLILSVATAMAGAWLFNQVFDGLTLSEILGSSYRANDLGNVHYYYSFGYVLVFAVAWFFRWPVSPQQRALATGIALLGGILPLLSVCFNYYLHSKWLIGDLFYLERWALASLLVAHGVILAMVNGMFYFANAKRPMRSTATQSAVEAPGRVAGTMYLGK